MSDARPTHIVEAPGDRTSICGIKDPAPVIAQGCWEGHIALAAAGDGGFGYDPVFIPQGGTLTISQLDEVAKNQASHRGQALQSLLARWPGSLR
jgi:XTP/dITP diphosphohydrolase